MNKRRLLIALALSLVMMLISITAAAGKPPSKEPTASPLVNGLEGALGSTVGPDGALYVTEGAAGRVSRVDPQTGDITTFASGLPKWVIPLGGAVDVAFLDGTAYVLVTLTNDPLLGGSEPGGIYRVDGPDSVSLIADISEFSINNEPDADIFIVTGVQYALETFRGGFLVTDGHHNRVLRVTLDGEITEMMTFNNIVPTGLETHGNTVFMSEAGPNPHLPENGKIITFGPKSLDATLIASGAPLLVDVEYGLGRTLYGLSQGIFEVGQPDGSPAMPNTGSLVKVTEDGNFSVVIDGLNQPTSLEFIGNTAYVVTLSGEIVKIDNVSGPPYGTYH